MALTERDRAILDFERTWWLEPGSKEQRIRDALAMSATRYYQLIAELVDEDEAMEYDPLVVRRVRRDRERRRRARFDRRTAEGPRVR